MKRVRIISYQDQDIVLTDLRRLEEGEVLAPIIAAAKIIRSKPEASVLTLTDASDARFNLRTESGEYDLAVAESIRSLVSGNRPYIKAAAIVVGGDENKKILVEFFNRLGSRHLTILDTVDEACDWLLSQ